MFLRTLTVVLAVGFLVDAEAKPAPSPMVLPYGVPGPVLPGMLGAPVVQPMSPMMYPPTPALLAPHPPMLPIHPPVLSHPQMLPISSSTCATYAHAYVSSSPTNASYPIAHASCTNDPIHGSRSVISASPTDGAGIWLGGRRGTISTGPEIDLRINLS
nr:uncharacterized protein LOC113825597 [Penaeus vannamei]